MNANLQKIKTTYERLFGVLKTPGLTISADTMLNGQRVGEMVSALDEQIAAVEHENAELRAENKRLRQALLVVKLDFDRHGQSSANDSDGEYTQDYTTRREMLGRALQR